MHQFFFSKFNVETVSNRLTQICDVPRHVIIYLLTGRVFPYPGSASMAWAHEQATRQKEDRGRQIGGSGRSRTNQASKSCPPEHCHRHWHPCCFSQQLSIMPDNLELASTGAGSCQKSCLQMASTPDQWLCFYTAPVMSSYTSLAFLLVNNIAVPLVPLPTVFWQSPR